MWCFWAKLWGIFWLPEGALKIIIQLMHLILNLILTDGAGEISSPMTGMSFINSAVKLINWKCRPNWDINWKFNWLINYQLKLVAIPTTDCKPWVNFAAFIWIKWHPDPRSYHGRQRMSWSCLQTFGAHGMLLSRIMKYFLASWRSAKNNNPTHAPNTQFNPNWWCWRNFISNDRYVVYK